MRRARRSEENTSELQSLAYLVCRLLLEKKKKIEEMHLLKKERPNELAMRRAPCRNHIMERHSWDEAFNDLLGVAFFFFFNDPATTEIYTFSLHGALPF